MNSGDGLEGRKIHLKKEPGPSFKPVSEAQGLKEGQQARQDEVWMSCKEFEGFENIILPETLTSWSDPYPSFRTTIKNKAHDPHSGKIWNN